MTDIELFDAAVEHAKSIAFWRKRATEERQRELAGIARTAFDLTPRQCLARVRYGQARVVDLAIVAECRAQRDFQNCPSV